MSKVGFVKRVGVDCLVGVFWVAGFLVGSAFMLVVADGPRPVRCRRCRAFNLRPLSYGR